MFQRYTFEDPSDQSHRVDVSTLGYVAAALAGSLYVLWKAGLPGFVAALLPHAAVMGTVIAATGVTSLALPGAQQAVVLIVAIPALLTIQSLMMVAIILRTYRHRGWIVDAVV